MKREDERILENGPTTEASAEAPLNPRLVQFVQALARYAARKDFDAAMEAAKANRARVDEDDSKGIAELKSRGMSIVENVDKAKFVATLTSVNAEFEKQFGKDNLDKIRAVK